ncbi:hypothetical protein GMES_0605 [Paraglaciecola mesophila KMM 241]|uniref:Uncharacterized protein n=1 Tax=Paraglaciecola mesophila KMM 241 TaxID=1128912 RepID=K6YG22_9ALTE|nr:hypothetical protein GMES_0605 [Paraglaciecola mesophila KMM 241]
MKINKQSDANHLDCYMSAALAQIVSALYMCGCKAHFKDDSRVEKNRQSTQ